MRLPSAGLLSQLPAWQIHPQTTWVQPFWTPFHHVPCFWELDLDLLQSFLGHMILNVAHLEKSHLCGWYCHFSCQYTLLCNLYDCHEESSHIQLKLLEVWHVIISLCGFIQHDGLNYRIQLWAPHAITIRHTNMLNLLFEVCIGQHSGEGHFQEHLGWLRQSH